MAKQKTIPQLEAEKAENERKITQLQHKKQQLENRITYYEKGDRRKRAHHLITRGAAIESVAPLTKVLTENEFYAFAEKALAVPEVKGFVCANYRSNTGSCSAHFIRAVVLEDLVWMHMKVVIFYVTRYENHFRAVMEHKLLLSSEEAIRGHRKRLAQAEKRLTELDRLFIRIYEDNVAGRINDERFSMMSRSYETEQEQLKMEIQTLQQDIEVQERQIENLEQFIQRVHKYEDLDELTPYALRELVKAIYIEAPDKNSGKRRQNIRISYDLVGFIPLNELMKEETA